MLSPVGFRPGPWTITRSSLRTGHRHPPPSPTREDNRKGIEFHGTNTSCGSGSKATHHRGPDRPVYLSASKYLRGGGGRDASEGEGPQRPPQRRLGRRLEEVAKAVGGGYCRLQMPLRLALGVRGTVAGRRLDALGGGGGLPPPFQCIFGRGAASGSTAISLP